MLKRLRKFHVQYIRNMLGIVEYNDLQVIVNRKKKFFVSVVITTKNTV